MVEIWRDVLGRPDIGVLDDFFDLDGNSMHAIQVIARIRETCGVSVRAIDFFESPTVAALAAAVAAQAPAERPLVGRRPPDAEPVLSFDQQRLWLADQLLPGGAYNVHGRRRLLGPLDVPALVASLRAILLRHEALRTRLPDVDGEPLQVVDEFDPDWRPRTADVSDADDPLEAARRLADEDATAPFDLARGPLFRCLLVRLGDTDHVLSITAHHTVCDDWSVGIFIQELSALYRAGGDVDRAELPELTVQYRDFAAWQQQWLAGEALERRLTYWREHLDGAPLELTLPTSDRPGTAPGAGGRVRFTLSTTDTAALRAMCRAYDVTLFMALLAGLAAVLGRWSGQRDLVIGVPITGRTDAGTKNLIGLFFNTLPMRVDLSGEPTFAELLGRARETALNGYAHADAPLDLVVRAVRPARVAGRTPLFQVALNVVDRPMTEGLGDVADEPMDGPVTPSKIDFVLNGREFGGSLLLELEYAADRFDEDRMLALLAEVSAVLVAASADPATAVFDGVPVSS
jgi:acyl carrier protein